MDIHESTADAKEKVSVALDLFRQRVLDSNRIEFAQAIQHFDDADGPVDLEDDEALELRIIDIIAQVTTDEPDEVPNGVKLPADILVAPGVISDGTAPIQYPPGVLGTEHWLIEIEAKMQAAARPELSHLTLPKQYTELMRIVDSVHGVGNCMGSIMDTCICLTSLDLVEVPPLVELIQLLGLGSKSEELGFEVGAGFICSSGSTSTSAGGICGIAYCQRGEVVTGLYGGKMTLAEKRWGWRIFFLRTFDYVPIAFENIPMFLEWYAGYRITKKSDWDEENGKYV